VLDNLVGHRAGYEYLAAVLFIHEKYCYKKIKTVAMHGHSTSVF
jgi:hypothetical protein